MNKGLISSLTIIMVGFAFIIALALQPRASDDIIGIVFPLSTPSKDAFAAVIAAGGQPISTGLNDHILIVGRTEMFKADADELGALFLFRAQGAWGCSSSKAQAVFANEKAYYEYEL